jgi:mRNA-degrading endonuclease toxin of MazEF toxin-antitoxin module
MTSSSVKYGDIIWARVRDRRGIAKERPCIIITPTELIRPDGELLLMAITTTFPDPPPQWHVPLPWNPDFRRVGTRLAQRSAAVITWLDVVPAQEVRQVMGRVPPKQLREIERLQAELLQREGEAN